MPLKIVKVEQLTRPTRQKQSVVTSLPEFIEATLKLSHGLKPQEGIEITLPKKDERGYNSDTQLDLLPTEDRDKAIRQLAETLKPIPFEGGTSASDEAGEQAFRKLIRLIIRHAYERNPKPLPVIVFLHGDHTGQPHGELNTLVDDFLETSGIVFGIRDYRSPNLHFIIGEQAKIMHYMAEHTGGEYFSVPPSEYEKALTRIMMQLHFRYELGFIPPGIDGKRHELRVELTKAAKAEHKGLRLRYRPEYIPVQEEPEWEH